jgi:flagellin
MPSVSNIAIGANMAAAAANKARHGMNESIARLSTGVRAMYGADAAGHSMGKNIQAIGQSYGQAVRNIEDGISYAQMGESLLLEIGNLAQRLRELGIAADNDALIDDNQMAAFG